MIDYQIRFYITVSLIIMDYKRTKMKNTNVQESIVLYYPQKAKFNLNSQLILSTCNSMNFIYEMTTIEIIIKMSN